MKNLQKTFFAVVVLVLCLCFVGCGVKPTVYKLNLVRFNTAVNIEVYDNPIDDSVKSQITTLLSDLDNELSVSTPSSSLSEFNATAKEQKISFSSTAIELILKAKAFYTQTSSRFNFAVYPLVKLWQFSPDTFKANPFSLPSPSDISDTLALCDPDKIIVDGNAVYKTLDGAMLDLGGLAKGYAVNAVTEILKANGHTSGYVSIGGSSLSILSLQGENNYLSIRHPRATADMPTVLKFSQSYVKNTAVSTSGDYERYYEYDGNRYSHIIDAKTGYPTDTGIVSATVLGSDPCFLDALSTALCLTPIDEIEGFISNFSNLKFFIFYHGDGVKQLITNEKQSENFTLLDDGYTKVVI